MGEFQALVPDRCRLPRSSGVAALACGFSCPDCGQGAGWRLGDGRFMCAGCGGRISVTAGTVFDRTRTPLTVWFNACWLFELIPRQCPEHPLDRGDDDLGDAQHPGTGELVR